MDTKWEKFTKKYGFDFWKYPMIIILEAFYEFIMEQDFYGGMNAFDRYDEIHKIVEEKE